MTQLNLFDSKRADDRKQRNMKAVLDNENEKWKEEALIIIKMTALTFKEFTFDDVRRLLRANKKEEPHHPNVYGSLMRLAAIKGWIKKTDRVRPSSMVQAHSRNLTIWESKL
jgi:hypothetical protein